MPVKICTNCGTKGFTTGDPYARSPVFCSHCGSTDYKLVDATVLKPELKYVDRYCSNCCAIIPNTGYNRNNTICPHCFGNIIKNNE